MTVVVAGGSGALGRRLTTHLTTAGHTVVVLGRRERGGTPGARFVRWTPDGTSGPWAEALDGADAVVNLAGAGIADRRWTPARKQELWNSRVLSTRSLVAALGDVRTRPRVFVQHTAVGYYGTAAGARELDESSPAGSDFFGRLAVAWEAEAEPVTGLGCRLVVIRSGVVLDPEHGALKRLLPPFRLFVGGPIATGRQYLSWIHVEDWLALMVWTLTTERVSGAINATAPHPVTNAAFSRAIGRAIGRPSWLPVPGFALRLLVGELADSALINGQRVRPTRALALGFRFSHPEIGEALQDLVGSRGRQNA